jgi:hypothetical protein
MNLFTISNPHNVKRRIGAEQVVESGRDWQVLSPEEGDYFVAVLYHKDSIISATIFITRDAALEDVGCV